MALRQRGWGEDLCVCVCVCFAIVGLAQACAAAPLERGDNMLTAFVSATLLAQGNIDEVKVHGV